MAVVVYRGGKTSFKFQVSLVTEKKTVYLSNYCSSRRPPKKKLTHCINKSVVVQDTHSDTLAQGPPAIHSRMGAAAAARTLVVRGSHARCFCILRSSTTHAVHITSTQKNKAVPDTQATNLRGKQVVELGQLGQIMDEGVQLSSEDVVHEPRRCAAVQERP